MKTAETGSRGEDAALAYLRSIGYRFHARNVRMGRDEIDLILFDPGDRVIVFVEVKSRSRYHADFSPALNLTRGKRAAMRRAAQRWIDRRGYEGGWRLDVVLVAENRILDHWIDVAS